jgi:hypothetical protein
MKRLPQRPRRRSLWIDVLLSMLAIALVHTFLVTIPAYLVSDDSDGTQTALTPAPLTPAPLTPAALAQAHGAVTPVESIAAPGPAGGGAAGHQAPAAPRN